MKKAGSHRLFLAAIGISLLLHGAILFASYRKIDLLRVPIPLHISIRTHEVLPYVNTPSEITRVKRSPSKSDEGTTIATTAHPASFIEDSESSALRYTDMIRQKIYSVLTYPPKAREDGIEGRTVIRYSLNKNGELLSAEVVRSSGFAILDDEALRAIHRASPFPKIPASFNKSQLTLIHGLTFELK